MKSLIYSACVLVCLFLSGCKPKEITLSGQVFIITRGAENIKLGLVEVQLIDKNSVRELLLKRQPAIDEEFASLKKVFESCNINMTNTNDMEIPLKQSYGRTNYLALLEYRKHLVAELQNARINAPKLRQQADASMLRYQMGQTHSSFEAHRLDDEAYVMNKHIEAFQAEIDLTTMNIERLEKKFFEAKARLDLMPNAKIYIEDFSPSSFSRTLTDAEGRFLLSYPHGKTFSLFAKAERFVGDKTETYYWLVDAPSEVEKAQILLSNQNLVAVDPDGYFKTKPKLEL